MSGQLARRVGKLATNMPNDLYREMPDSGIVRVVFKEFGYGGKYRKQACNIRTSTNNFIGAWWKLDLFVLSKLNGT